MLIYPDGLFFDLWIFRPFPIQVVASTELFVVSYVGQDHSVAGVLAWSRGLPCLATGTRTRGAFDIRWKMLEDVGRSQYSQFTNWKC